MPSFPVAPGGDEFMSLIQASVTAATWKGYDGSSPVVLLVGHSYICRAALRAENRPGGKNLGFSGTRVIWRGISGMRWLQVLPEVVRFSRAYDGPLVLVIHAGGNDLCQVRVAELISLIKSDMVRFPPFFMDLVIVWSELVPRLAWITGDIDKFLAEMKLKAKDCEFKDTEDLMLRDKIVFSITNPALKEKLLADSDLTLEKAVSDCRIKETTKAS
ncbi:uncharacterized protein LOC121398745 [Xenopus laevis]|uniref:Uncharacterized protein LOC121398745 n=1 Tax=Xenopus laevis TaxID=8355 RepID=A0A8J1LWG5_XENLA|nr:uncharacterized protein LOC121398745 [Xenopus laevis]